MSLDVPVPVPEMRNRWKGWADRRLPVAGGRQLRALSSNRNAARLERIDHRAPTLGAECTTHGPTGEHAAARAQTVRRSPVREAIDTIRMNSKFGKQKQQ